MRSLREKTYVKLDLSYCISIFLYEMLLSFRVGSLTEVGYKQFDWGVHLALCTCDFVSWKHLIGQAVVVSLGGNPKLSECTSHLVEYAANLGLARISQMECDRLNTPFL